MDVVLTFSELNPSTKIKVVWGLFWRSLLITACSLVCGMIAGFIVGMFVGIALGVAGLAIEDYASLFRLMGYCVGMLVGACFFVVYVYWIFSARIGPYGLRLVKPGPIEPVI